LWLVWAAGCIGPKPAGEEQQPPKENVPDELSRYDPLGTDQNRQVVPEAFPNDSPIDAGKPAQSVSTDSTAEEGLIVGPEEQIDSLNNQAFRVQILTTKVYGEARAARRVAEEIFDRPVFMDYEVPYFKIRVGNFPDRAAAEDYQQKAKAAGYSNAWVVVVTVGVQEAPPLNDSLPPVTGDSLDSDYEPGGDD